MTEPRWTLAAVLTAVILLFSLPLLT
ncbi:MAG: hypothetical protein JWQ17_3110, partial [Tardiphaga sp.]|nr:hypothetical protein [Tardiphaga sp.]